MAGIITILNNNDAYSHKHVVEQFNKGSHRGSKSVFKRIIHKVDGGMHYDRGGPPVVNDHWINYTQPLTHNCIALLCDGDIYNYAELHQLLVSHNVTNNPDGPAKFELENPEKLTYTANEKRNAIIIQLYERFGIEETLQLLDGDFAFVLIDYRLSQTTSKIYVARDPYGIRPLYQFSQSNVLNKNNQIFAFASEEQMLSGLHDNEYYCVPTITSFTPGCYSVFELSSFVNSSWKVVENNVRYHTVTFAYNTLFLDIPDNTHNINDQIQYYLYRSIEKRMDDTESHLVACVLNGDIESSILAAIMSDYRKQHKLPALETYSTGFADEDHMVYAKLLAEYIGSNHTEIVVTKEQIEDAKQTFTNEGPNEGPNDGSTDDDVLMWLLSDFVAKNTETKIVFTGDGLNAYMGGYSHMKRINNAIDFDRECRRLLTTMYKPETVCKNNVLNSERSLSAHGLEYRMPYMDRAFVQMYMSIPLEYRFHSHTIMEKQILRNAFAPDKLNRDLVPECILWHTTVETSDTSGTSVQKLSNATNV